MKLKILISILCLSQFALGSSTPVGVSKQAVPQEIIEAIFKAKADQVEELWSSNNDLIYERDLQGRTMLHFAVSLVRQDEKYVERMRIVSFLIEKGASPDAVQKGGSQSTARASAQNSPVPELNKMFADEKVLPLNAYKKSVVPPVVEQSLKGANRLSSPRNDEPAKKIQPQESKKNIER